MFVFTKTRIIIISLILLIIIFIVAFFLLTKKPPKETPVNLTIWGTHENQVPISALIEYYKSLRPNVNIIYREFAPATYESELINLLAINERPDIFMIHNTWLQKHKNKMISAPKEQLPFNDYEATITQIAVDDLTYNNEIFASPLYLDSLAMFLNKTAMESKGIAFAPKTWDEFKNVVRSLRVIDANTNIIKKSAAAIGGSEISINRGVDLLQLIMLQSGITFVKDGRANFANIFENNKNIGEDALNFYLDFSDPSSKYYTWNDNLHYSIDDFTEGNTYIIFNYSHQIPIIKEKNPFLRFEVAPIPQVNPNLPVAFGNYWALAVSKDSANPTWAWDFIIESTLIENGADTYLKASNRPPAMRSLIQKYSTDTFYRPFVAQALVARSTKLGDVNYITQIFSRLIQDILIGKISPKNGLDKAEDEINASLIN